MTDSGIVVKDNRAASRFEAEVDGLVSIAEYRLKPGVIMFTHTEVPEALAGRGIGSALAKAGLKAAREENLKVVPACSFFASYMQRHPETQDLLHADHSARST